MKCWPSQCLRHIPHVFATKTKCSAQLADCAVTEARGVTLLAAGRCPGIAVFLSLLCFPWLWEAGAHVSPSCACCKVFREAVLSLPHPAVCLKRDLEQRAKDPSSQNCREAKVLRPYLSDDGACRALPGGISTSCFFSRATQTSPLPLSRPDALQGCEAVGN